MLNCNILYIFISYIYFHDISNLIYLPILVHIINVTTLCLIKEPFKEYYLLIYLLLFRVLIYLYNLFTLPILVLISIITILMCLIYRIYHGSPILLPGTVILLCKYEKFPVFCDVLNGQ